MSLFGFRRVPASLPARTILGALILGASGVAFSGGIVEYPVPSAVSHAQRITTGPDGNIWFTGRRNKIGRLAAGTVTTFQIPTSDAYPLGIAAGLNDDLWFVESRGNKIGRITSHGAVTEFGPVGSPYAIAAGSDGNMWFVEFSLSPAVGRITPAGVITEFPLPPSSAPTSIASGPDGNLWFTERDAGKIGRITPSGTITEFPVPATGSLPTEITAGPDGNLWFTDSGTGSIGRITTTGVISELPLPGAPGAHSPLPEGIVAGPDGALWATDRATRSFWKITIDGVITEFPVSVDATPRTITTGPDGALWFPTEGVTTVGRLTTNGAMALVQIADGGCAPSSVAAGPDGNVWFTESEGHRITRITPAGAVTRFPLPPQTRTPWALAAGTDGNLWFAGSDAPAIGRISMAGSITIFPLPGPDFPMSIAAGPDGAMWFTTNTDRVGRIPLTGAGATFFDLPAPFSFLRQITAGPDGNLWFTEAAARKIGRMTPEGDLTEFPVPGQPWAIAPGPDGQLWFSSANPEGGNRISRISTSGAVFEFPVAGNGFEAVPSLATGPDGNVWLAVSNSNAIARLTPGGVRTTFALPTDLAFPSSIVLGPDGNLWFAEPEADQVGKAIPDKPLTATGLTVTVSPAFSFTKTVATFLDADPSAMPADFSSSIDWGDGFATSGIVAAAANGFEVRGSHAYLAAGSYSVTVTITDVDEQRDLGGSSAVAHSTASVAPLAIETGSVLPRGIVGAPYGRALVATGGTPPYAWSITSGSLPAPLALSPAGALAGTPAGPGVFVFTAKVTDAAGGAVSRDFTLPIDSVETSRSALTFFTVPPCRLLDTRNAPDGAFAGPPLQPLSVRTFPVSAGPCGIPAYAKAVSANATATRASMPGSLSLFPGNEFAPGTNSLSFGAGQTRACNLLLTLASDGTASFTAISYSNGPVDLILDVNGYFK